MRNFLISMFLCSTSSIFHYKLKSLLNWTITSGMRTLNRKDWVRRVSWLFILPVEWTEDANSCNCCWSAHKEYSLVYSSKYVMWRTLVLGFSEKLVTGLHDIIWPWKFYGLSISSFPCTKNSLSHSLLQSGMDWEPLVYWRYTSTSRLWCA